MPHASWIPGLEFFSGFGFRVLATSSAFRIPGLEFFVPFLGFGFRVLRTILKDFFCFQDSGFREFGLSGFRA